ncbi:MULTISPECIES: universal stress protein [Clostridium]|uniref:Predicted universal stress protein n=2 Tax=Clostridium TaxID=1485 RepID=D8GTY1_CLOLD|nr:MULTISPECIES: universal stress protein [Clostridium]ADK16794.1 predicted universal stress protein [Clostridium ljungdahlii DSM 13528]OAA85666.1 Universal stress protein family protein [Clostridium ljungdahlii DSM 13528]RMC93122.1 universal stress protein [Clostridium autoethanogenum]
MAKTKILIPLDGTDRSMHSLDLLKKMFKKDEVEVTLMNISEIVIVNDMVITDKVDRARETGELVLDRAEKELQGYTVNKFFDFGYAGDEILKKASQDNFDIIIMTKSTKKGLARMVGSVTSKVVKNSPKIVIIVPE